LKLVLQEMLSMRRIGLAVALSIAACPAFARPASLEGKWQLNLGESELLAGDAPPAQLVMAITQDDGKKFRWTVTVKMPDGSSGATKFDGAIDGKPYPIAGRPGSTSAFSWTGEGSLKQVSQSAGGISVEICGFSGGGPSGSARRMTCSARQTDMQGRVVTYVEVFDRA
jgi:hypothetical protein